MSGRTRPAYDPCGHLRLYVRFEGETEPVSVRPHLVRVLPAQPLTAGHIVGQLRALLPQLPQDDGHDLGGQR